MTTAIAGGGRDTTPPGAPGTLTATAASSSQINLSWGAATDNIGGHRLPGRALPGRRLLQLRPDRHHRHRHHLQRHRTQRRHQLQLPRPRDRRRRQPRPLLNTATADHRSAPIRQPPSAPGTLTATAASASQIDLSWGAATDNVGVTGYRVERCQGAGCSHFAQIAHPHRHQLTTTPALSGRHQLQLPGPRRRRRRQPRPLLNIATATTQAARRAGGLVAAYAFDEGTGTTVADASGNGNTGTIANATWTSERQVRQGACPSTARARGSTSPTRPRCT